MEALVTTTSNRIGGAWKNFVIHLREQNSVEQIAARLHTDEPVVGLERAAQTFAASRMNAYTNAGQVTAKWVRGQVDKRRRIAKKHGVFDQTEPGAVRWAEQNKLDAIREITNEQRDTIREILTAGARSGANPNVVAKEIRDSIGLTVKQEQFVENYRRQLERGQYVDALERQLSSGHSDRVIRSAMAAERSLTTAQIDTAVERYRANFQLYRAETIARTEGLRVAHQASDELYRQAVINGDLEADQIERTWIHVPGRTGRKNERVFHATMNGQTRGFGELFISGLGGELRFPGDPEAAAEEVIDCRCVVTTRIRPVASAAGAQEQGGPGRGAGEAEETAVEVGDEEELAAEEEAAASEEGDVGEEEMAAEVEGAVDEELAPDEAEPVVEPEPLIDDVAAEPIDVSDPATVAEEALPPDPVEPVRAPERSADWAKEELGPGAHTREEWLAADTYTGGEYNLINRFLRKQENYGRKVSGRTLTLNKQTVATTIRHLDGLIARTAAPESLTVFRGVRGLSFEVGDLVSDLGYQSTTIDREIAERNFGGLSETGSVIHLEIPAGQPALWITGISGGAEQEVLLPRNTRYRVISIDGNVVHARIEI